MMTSHPKQDKETERVLVSVPAVFVLGKNALKNRYEVSYHKPKYRKTYGKLRKCQFKLKNLGEISRIFSGITPLSGGPAYVNEGGIPFVRSGDINEENEIDFGRLLQIKHEIHNKLMRSSRLKRGDLLIAIVGATIGQVGLYKYDREANINQAIAGVRLKGNVNPEYVQWFLLTKTGQLELERLKRPVARANINLREVGSLKVPIPPRKIQDKIVEYMKHIINTKKEMTEKANRILESINNYISTKMEIRLPEYEKTTSQTFKTDAKDIMKKRWNVEYWKPKYQQFYNSIRTGKYNLVRFGEVIDNIVNGVDYRTFTEEGTEYLRVSNIKPFEIDQDDVKKIDLHVNDLKKDVKLEKGDILLTRKGTFGVATVVTEKPEYIISSEIFKIRLKRKMKVNPFYIVSILNSDIGKIQFFRNSTGTIMGNLAQKAVNQVLIPIPPQTIQNQVADEVKTRIRNAKNLLTNAEDAIKQAKIDVEKTIFGE